MGDEAKKTEKKRRLIKRGKTSLRLWLTEENVQEEEGRIRDTQRGKKSEAAEKEENEGRVI